MKNTLLLALELGLQKRKQLTLIKLERAKTLLDNSKIGKIQKELVATYKHVKESPGVKTGILLAQELLDIKEKKQKLDFLSLPYVREFIAKNRGSKGKNVYFNKVDNPLNLFFNVSVNEAENILEYLLKENKEKNFDSELQRIRDQIDKNEGYFSLLRLNVDLETAKSQELSSVESLRVEMLEHELVGIDMQLQALHEFNKIKVEAEPGESSPTILFSQPSALPSLLEMLNSPEPVNFEGLPNEIPDNNKPNF